MDRQPFRAAVLAGLLLIAWLQWRSEIVGRDFAAAIAPLGFTARPPAPAPRAIGEADGFGWQSPTPELEAHPPLPPAIALPGAPPPTVTVLVQPAASPPADRRAGEDGRVWRELGWAYGGGAEPEPERVPPARPAEARLLAAAAPAPPARSSPADGRAWAAADRAYGALGRGDRRAAAAGFGEALALAPGHPNARVWRDERTRLTRRLRLETYVFLRDDGPVAFPAGRPLAGGSAQATIGWSPDPLARRPVEVVARYFVPVDGRGQTRAYEGQGAVGVGFRPLPAVPATITAEWLFPVGEFGRSDWSIRVAGGASRALTPRLAIDGYGEAGVIGGSEWFMGGQAAVRRRFALPLGLWATAGAGVWGSVQEGYYDSGRLDTGPVLQVGDRRGRIAVAADYRVKLMGSAQPASGPSVTVSSRF